MADLVSGAIVGAVVGELLRKVINVAEMAYRCKKNCEILLITLNSISPLLDQAAKSADNGNVTCQAWLESIGVLLTKAESITEKCCVKKWTDRINYVKRSKLSSQIMEIDSQIRMKLPESNLITLDIVQTIEYQSMMKPSASNFIVDSSLETRMQDIPNITVPFVANPFDKLKSIIVGGAKAMDAPMTIGLRGRGGAGKTLLAKMINNDGDIQSKYAMGSIMWITIGRDATIPFLYLTMAKLIHDGVYERDYVHRNLEDQRGYLMEAFKKKKVLLILDDVWDHYPAENRAMIEWLDIAKGPGSVTLVTTRDISVLKCAKAKETVDVQSLSKQDSWELFCIHAFGSIKPPSLLIEDIAKDICKECDGLPLAIKVMGSAMWEKNDERDWRATLNYLKGTTSMPHSKSIEKALEKKLYNHLQYSYDELDDASKNCFLYFAAFPEDFTISTNNLYCVWHAEQLFGSINVEETKNIGRKVLIDLVDRSLIDLFEDGEFVQIHDVLRDLAIRILCNAKPTEWASECYFQPGKVFETFPMIKKTTHRVSLMGCSIGEFPNNLELPFLQVCILSKISSANDKERLVIPKGFFSSMSDLQLLDISQTLGVTSIDLNFQGLKSLTHLDLRRCKSLKELPESIKELKSLAHLDLTWCESLKELPESIRELKFLTHLDLFGCKSLKELPESIRELKPLTHLDLSGCESLKELSKSIKKLKSLTHLDLSWCESLKELPESIKELKSLTHLDLSGCKSLKELPESIKELKSLTHLDLSWCESLKELPESIKELKSLTHLDLSQCRSLKELPESIKELKSLTHLDLS